ncbi:MAG: DNA polymerase III subunit alpha [Chloroflexota bacterium]
MKLTHLHTHSHFSFMRATPSIEALIEKAAEESLPALALTDWEGLFGAVRFHHAALKAGILPILGLSVPVATGLFHGEENQRTDRMHFLARNRAGYSNLSRLASLLQADPKRGEYARHGIPLADLSPFGEEGSGLIQIIGGFHSHLFDYTISDQTQAYLNAFSKIFSSHTYLALEYPDLLSVEPTIDLIKTAHHLGIKPVAQRPIYTLSPEDQPLLQLMRAIDLNIPLSEVGSDELPHRGRLSLDLSWRPAAALAHTFSSFPAALESIGEIIDACEPSLPDGRPIWPTIQLPKGETPDSVLTRLVTEAIERRYQSQPEVVTRAEKELSLVQQHGFAPLFLILADVVHFVRENNIPMNSRGSVANSLIAYALEITNVDPIKHNLYFERFLNPARTSLPDIDLDFDSRLRDEVLDYIRQTYGVDQVALISTVNYFRSKSAVRETAKALGLPKGDIGMLAEAMPNVWAPSPELRKEREIDIRTLVEQFPDRDHQEVILLASQIIGMPSHLGLHPGGVVIAPPPGMTHYAPLHHSPKGYLATQFDHRDVEALGLVKVDLLGIRALSVIRQAIDLVQQSVDPDFDIDAIDPDDPTTGNMLEQGDSIGLFQAESRGSANTLRKLKARNGIDLAICNAFFKPGPVLSGMANDFVARYRGEQETDYLHPALEPILKNTRGTILFQEQVLQICVEVAQLSWKEANQMRKGISKFAKSMLEALEERFKRGCVEQSSFTPAEAETLWGEIRSFAGFGFNQGHATAYALPTYQMGYLKAHFPAQFMSARMAEYGGYYPQSTYIAEVRRLGMAVYPPCVNHSNSRFTLSYEPAPTHWMGLGAIRDLRRSTVQAIIEERAVKRFENIGDLMRRVSFQAKEIEHLIQCGGADTLGGSRAALLNEANTLLEGGGGSQMALFDFQTTIDVEPETIAERFSWEMHILGLPVSVHPLDLLDVDRSKGVSLENLRLYPGKSVWTLGTKLPGWTGIRRNTCYLDDGTSFILLKYPDKTEIKSWQAYAIKGSYQTDRWGGAWLEAERVAAL